MTSSARTFTRNEKQKDNREISFHDYFPLLQ